MSKFSNITVVSVDGRGGDHFGAQCAIKHSMNQLPGACGLLLSPHAPQNLLPGILHQPITSLGYFDYSLFVVYLLHHYIQTDYALIVQDDGWVLNGANWDDAYLDTDYIGAPTHFARIVSPAGAQYFRHFRWNQFYKQRSAGVALDVAMNGGFSLRSKKMLEAPQALGLEYILPPPTLSQPLQSMQWESDAHVEDVQLSIHMRDRLCDAGIRYANLELAKQFSIEHLDPIFHAGSDMSKLFGHHSKIRKLISLEPLTIQYLVSENQISSIPFENFFLENFRNLGYQIIFK